MIATYTLSSCSNCNILNAQNKQLCLELEEARQKQDSDILLAQFACAVTARVYAVCPEAAREDATKFIFDTAVAMLAEYKKRTGGE